MDLKFLLYTMVIMAMIKGCPNFNWLICLDLGVIGLNEVCENVMCSHGLVERAVSQNIKRLLFLCFSNSVHILLH